MSSGADAWASIILIVMVRVSISGLISTRAIVLIVLYQRTLGHIVIVIETLANILDLS